MAINPGPSAIKGFGPWGLAPDGEAIGLPTSGVMAAADFTSILSFSAPMVMRLVLERDPEPNILDVILAMLPFFTSALPVAGETAVKGGWG